MAEGKGSVEPLNPFHIEALILMNEEAETCEKRLKARLAKDVNTEQKDATKPLVARPVWPYEMWCTNYVDSSWDFNPQTRHCVSLSRTSENQASQKANWGDCFSLDTAGNACESPLASACEADTSKESNTANAQSLDDMADIMQRAINMLSDLQNLLSVGMEKFGDIYKSASTIKEDEQTQATLANSDTTLMDASKPTIETVKGQTNSKVDENQVSYDGDVGTQQSTPLDFDMGSNRKMECEVALTSETFETEESSGSNHVQNVCDEFDCKEDTRGNRSEGIMETKSTGKRTETDECKEGQMEIKESEQNTGDRCLDKAPKQGKVVNTFKIHHFKTELQSPVSAQSVLHNSIKKWLPNISIDESTKTERIKQFVRSLMDNTIHELQAKCSVFSKCYIIETGSMAEGTKIGHPDEFDFTVALPVLSDSDVAELLYIKLGIQTRPHEHMSDKVVAFLRQFPFVDTSYVQLLTNAYLLQVFRDTLRKHLPVDWTMLEESDMHMMRVFLKNQTLTVHLQCTSGRDLSFMLSIDVCFGIPLDAERLQTVHVGDLTHAVHLSFIRSECIRMNTGVVAVISRNPLVAERFLYETEPCRFHGKSLVTDCYKLAKHVARTFLPKINKNNCNLCEDTLIPSFYMKNAVMFMMDVYAKKSEWSGTQLANRLIEIFEIISYCFLSKYRSLAYYSYINGIKLDSEMKYSPTDGSIKVGIGMDDDKPCTIPCMEDINLASSHVNINTAVKRYWKYMECEEWTVGDLLHKLTELLYVFKFTDQLHV